MGGHSEEYHRVVGQLDDESAEGEEIADQPEPGGAVAVAEVAEHEALRMVLMS